MVETGDPRGERLEADDLAFGEASRIRLDGSRLNTEGGLPPHAPKIDWNTNIFASIE